ncbi:MAG: hypothetical protein N3C12_05820 [Candidatus Binatia bacterium]|nr:hypothetical protein [Candidatus Binatia bacterium]
MPSEELVERIVRVVRPWLAPDSPWMARACSEMPEATGFHPAMIAHALPFQLELLEAAAIRAVVERELGSLRALDEADWPLRVIVHVVAGNIPALAAVPIAFGLLAKQATIVKPASGDPLFPDLFHCSLRSMDPELARAVAIVEWRGGAAGIEDVVFDAADVVVAMGGAVTMASLQSRLGSKLRAFGPRLSFALVGKECLQSLEEANRWACALAYDVSVWDQRGCLSPQIAYVERGAPVEVAEFAAMVGDALQRFSTELPPRRLTLAEQVAVRLFRAEAEWQDGVRLLASQGDLSWTVTVEPRPSFTPTPQHRCLRVQPIAHVEEILPVVAEHRAWLEAAGLAVGPQRWADTANALQESGVHWVTTLGTMQRPTLEWRPGGRDRIKDWL